MASRRTMVTITLLAAAAVFAAACSASAATNAPTQAATIVAQATIAPTVLSTPLATATAGATDTPAASATSALTLPSMTAVPMTIDPCQLFSAEEASQLTGAKYGPGKRSTTSGNAQMCVYGANTTDVFEVVIAQAPDAAAAKAAKAKAQAEAAKQVPAGVTLTNLPDFADGASVLQASNIEGMGINASGIYALKGVYFVSLNDVARGLPAPSSQALEAAAQVVFGRLP